MIEIRWTGPLSARPGPDYIFGMTNNFSYKGFDLSILIQVSQGNDVINLNRNCARVCRFSRECIKIRSGLLEAKGAYLMQKGLGESVGRCPRFIEDSSYVRVKIYRWAIISRPMSPRALGLSMRVM